MTLVVFPTPPFWLTIEITRAGPWLSSAGGSGKSGRGRPVGPRSMSRVNLEESLTWCSCRLLVRASYCVR
jgi:hypothetical protein